MLPNNLKSRKDWDKEKKTPFETRHEFWAFEWVLHEATLEGLENMRDLVKQELRTLQKLRKEALEKE